MEFAEQERRPKQVVTPEYQSVSAEGSKSEPTLEELTNGVDHSKIPKALQNTPVFGELPASPPERAQRQPDGVVPGTTPTLLAQSIALPAVGAGAGAGAAGVGTAGAGAGAGVLGVIGAGAALIWGGPLAQPTGDATLSGDHARRMRRQQILQSTSGDSAEGDASGKKKKKKKQTRQSGKEAASDVPSWAKGQKPREGESAQDFGERLLNEKYGRGEWKKGARSEYSEIVKNANRKRK